VKEGVFLDNITQITIEDIRTCFKERKKLRVLGIDTGLANIGWAVLEFDSQKVKLISSGVITTESDKPMGERLYIIGQSVEEVIKTYGVHLMAYEELFFNSTNMMNTNLAVGVIIHIGWVYGLNPHKFRPQDAKYYVTRNNSASKEEVSNAVAIHLGMLPNQLKKIQSVDHATDAMAHGLCYIGFIKEQLLEKLNPIVLNAKTKEKKPRKKREPKKNK